MMPFRMITPEPDPEHRLHRLDRPGEVQPYEVSDAAPIPPRLTGEVVIGETVEEVIDKLAADLVIHAENCVRQFGDFHLALSGGSTPQPLYERLMYDPNYRRLPWRRTHLWIVDERAVPFESPQCNFRMIDEIIVDHSDIPREQVHPMFAMSETGDVDYEQQLRDTLGWREKGQDRLDYVVLGMGGDGHTASLFPHTPPLGETQRLICFNRGVSADPPDRLTMTYPLINAARFIAIMVCGAGKAKMIRRVASEAGRETKADLPIKGIKPLNGELKWYLDAPAAGNG